jgi:hypothetical protein
MTLSTTSLAFPHPELTTITSEPASSSLCFSQRKLHANARQIHSTQGGGVNGHLRLVVTEADYFARAQVNFVAPQHPGDAPHHIHPATGLQIAETIRLFAQNADEHRPCHLVASELKKQILQAAPHRCLQILEDDDFGFADVSPLAILQHLQATYGQVRPDDLENDQTLLSAVWNPDDPIEKIWIQIRACQAFAATIEPISNNAAVRLTLTVFEKTGVFASAVDEWRDKPPVELTLHNFIAHFNFENKERLRKLAAQTAGCDGANQAVIVPPSPAAAAAANAAAAPVVEVDTVKMCCCHAHGLSGFSNHASVTCSKMHHCHAHGLSRFSNHTSITCSHPGAEHKTEATINNMLGGSNKIAQPRPRRPRFNA